MKNGSASQGGPEQAREVVLGSEHKIVQISSHVTSVVGRVGIVGLCSCGWLGSAEGDNTRIATNALVDVWHKEHGTKAASEDR